MTKLLKNSLKNERFKLAEEKNEKSFFYSITSTFVMFSFAFVSCKMQNLLCYSPDENNSSIITSKLGEFKKTGLLDSFYNNYARASVNEFEVENSDIQYFIDNSDECIAEILKEPDGNKSLAVLNAIYSESTVGDIYNAMNNLSSDLANEYESSLVQLYNEQINDEARYATNINTIRDVNIRFIPDSNLNRSADLSNSFTWGAVSGYIAASAGAIAGLLMWKYGGFWTRIAGLVAGGVGIAAMTTFIVIWQKSPDWKCFQNFCVTAFNFAKHVLNTYKNMSDSEKAKIFLDSFSKSLQEYVAQNSEVAGNIKEILLYIDKNYCEFGSVLEAIKGCIDCYNRNTDFFAKTTSIGASTAAVGVVAFCTCFCALVKGWISSISSLIPEWLTINGSVFVLSFCW